MKRFVAVFMSLVMVVMIFLPSVTVEASSAIESFQQNDSRWGSHSYGYQDTKGTVPATISTSGCGILALVNAVYYMNGNFIDPSFLADYSVSHGYRLNGVGTSHGLYSGFARDYGTQYGFKYVQKIETINDSAWSTLKSHIQAGGVAIVGAPGHLMALVDYDASNNKYLLLDSYKATSRGTYNGGYVWKTPSGFMNTAKTVFSSFMLLSPNGTGTGSQVVGCGCSDSYAGNYTCTAKSSLLIRSGHGTSYSSIGSIPSGATVYVSKANGSWAHVTYNGVSGYSSWNKMQVRCVVTDSNGNTVTSSAVTVTLKPVITMQPKSVTVTAGSKTTFTVKADGSGLTYQWYYKKSGSNNWSKWNGHTTVSTSATSNSTWDKMQVRCVVTDSNGYTVTSSAATITIKPIVITSQPSNVTVMTGSKATFTVKADGSGLKYQWYYKKAGSSSWSKWNGHTTASTSATSNNTWNKMQVRCVVTDSNGYTVTSSVATVTLK